MNQVQAFAEAMAVADYPLVLTDGQKNPGIVKDWPAYEWTLERIEKRFAKFPDTQVGIKLGDFADIEIDAPDPKALAAAMKEARSIGCDSVKTPAWKSRRGQHWLFRVTAQQRDAFNKAGCPSVVHVGALECRLGCAAAAQSVVPPSITDGVARTWLPGRELFEDCEPAILPDTIFNAILAEAVERTREFESENDALENPTRPGDFFNLQATWDEILVPLGWEALDDALADKRHWRRPGKDSGVSATTGFCVTTNRGDCFYSFSDAEAVAPFESKRSYSKFEAWALINCYGDLSEAARQLADLGYTGNGEEFGELEEIHKSVDDTPPTEFPPGMYDNFLGRYYLAHKNDVEPHVDNLLIQALVALGNVVGPDVKVRVNGHKLPLNMFLLLVGDTATSRKGTSLRIVKQPYIAGQQPGLSHYAHTRIDTGSVRSGEAMVEILCANEGEIDCRLLIASEEITEIFTVASWENSTLRDVLRKAYDGGRVDCKSRKNKLVAEDAHVSIIGHTTKSQFGQLFSGTDMANGVANRFLVVPAKRATPILDTSGMQETDICDLAAQIEACRVWAQNGGEPRVLDLTPDAKKLWNAYYLEQWESATEGIRGRESDYVLKLAGILSVARNTSTVSAGSMRTAIDFVTRLRGLGDSLFRDHGPSSDMRSRILSRIYDSVNPVSTTDLFKLFNGNVRAASIHSVLDDLIRSGDVIRSKMKTGKRGAPKIVFTPREK